MQIFYNLSLKKLAQMKKYVYNLASLGA